MSNQKIVTEAALSAIASDIKNALSGKANSNDVYPKSQTYNRTEIDNALELKADKSDTYTKEEVDNEVYNVLPTDTASGSIVHITDGADNIPVKLLVSQIVATGGGGTPDAPIAINGFDSGVITRCGKNLFNNTFSDYSRPSDYRIFPIKLKQGATYNFSAKLIGTAQTGFTVGVAKKGDRYVNFGSFYTICNGTDKMGSITVDSTFTDPKLIVYANTESEFNAIFENYEIQLNEGNLLPYTQYNGNTYTFEFGQTVYGGHFDNKGNLVVTHGYIASYNGETINEPWISSMDDYVPNTSPSIGAQVVYPLATPITLSITSQDIPTLLGENNIYSDTGDVDVTIRADIGLYIDKKMSSLAQA